MSYWLLYTQQFNTIQNYNTINYTCITTKSNIFSDLFVPNGFKMSTMTHLAKYSIKLHKGEVIRNLNSDGTKWLSIDFGEAPEVSYNYL